MRNRLPQLDSRSSLSFRLGHWFEARGTGWGVIAVPVLVVVVVLAAGRFPV